MEFNTMVILYKYKKHYKIFAQKLRKEFSITEVSDIIVAFCKFLDEHNVSFNDVEIYDMYIKRR